LGRHSALPGVGLVGTVWLWVPVRGSGEDRSRPGGIFLWPGLPVLGAALGGEAEIPAAG